MADFRTRLISSCPSFELTVETKESVKDSATGKLSFELEIGAKASSEAGEE